MTNKKGLSLNELTTQGAIQVVFEFDEYTDVTIYADVQYMIHNREENCFIFADQDGTLRIASRKEDLGRNPEIMLKCSGGETVPETLERQADGHAKGTIICHLDILS